VKFNVTPYVLCVLVAALLTPNPALGGIQYHPIGLDMVRANGIDTHNGEIQNVGVGQPPGMGFRGVWQTLGNGRSFMGTLPGGLFSEASAVRDGFAVGRSHGIGPNGLDYVRAFIYNHTGGSMMNLDTVSGLSEAFDLNDDYIVGTADFGTSISPRPTMWDRTSGTMTEIGNVPRGVARAINNNNQVVGNVVHNQGSGVSQAFRLLNGLNDVELLDIPNAFESFAWDINDSGNTVGHYIDTDTGARHAFMCRADGSFEFPSTLGGRGNSLNAINYLGTSVGNYTDVNLQIYGYIWDPIMGGRNANTLIDPNSGWIIRDLAGITDEGYMVGYGINPQGFAQALILIPVPGPSSGAVLVGFTTILSIIRRYR